MSLARQTVPQMRPCLAVCGQYVLGFLARYKYNDGESRMRAQGGPNALRDCKAGAHSCEYVDMCSHASSHATMHVRPSMPSARVGMRM